MTSPLCRYHRGSFVDRDGRYVRKYGADPSPEDFALYFATWAGYFTDYRNFHEPVQLWFLDPVDGLSKTVRRPDDIPPLCEPEDCEPCKAKAAKEAALTPYKFPDPDGETKTTDAQGNPVIRRNWERQEIPFDDD